MWTNPTEQSDWEYCWTERLVKKVVFNEVKFKLCPEGGNANEVAMWKARENIWD